MPMKFSVSPTTTGLKVDAEVTPEHQSRLLEEFGKCAAGTCSCPSTQYGKLSNINVTQTNNGVSVELTAKMGETIDQNDIHRCLEHTASIVSPE